MTSIDVATPAPAVPTRLPVAIILWPLVATAVDSDRARDPKI